MSERSKIGSASPYEKLYGFSRALRVGDTIHVAGTGPIMPDGSSCDGDAYVQTIRCLEIIKSAIEEAGGSIGDVVRTRMFITDVSSADEIGRAHGTFFSEIRPAATMVVVDGLVRAEWLVEIEADAVVGG
jgi:enamine deaminase RidA (YjgF/YER057c/UK114 family)